MEEMNYSKRELDHYFGDIKEILKKQNESLERIETQTVKTNGRVSKLEWWRGAIIWGLGALWTLLIILAPFIWSQIKEQQKRAAREAINAVLSNYEFEVEY